LDSSLCERPNPNPEETASAPNRAVSRTRAGKRKVHSLIDKVVSRQHLELAWSSVKKNRGSAGIDNVTITVFELRKPYYLELVHRKLRDGTYQPRPVKRVEMEKSDGRVRKLGIPTVLDRVVQQALVQRMEPIFEPQFLPCSFGYRTGRSPHDAMGKIWRELQAGDSWIVDADLRSYFDSIDQSKLVDLIAEEISDGRVLHVVWTMVRAGVMHDGYWQPTLTGVPQGAVVSPLWSTIYVTPFDRSMTHAGFQLTRWADDFVIGCQSRREAEHALALAKRFLQDALGVALHPHKTRIVHVRHGFEFLGYKVKRGTGYRLPAHKRRSRPNPQNLSAVPKAKSVKRFQNQIRALTRRKTPLTFRDVIDQINPVIRGWGTFYRKAHVRLLFNRLDRWIERRLYAFLAKRWRNGKWRTYPRSRLIEEFGLVRLTHLIPGVVNR
jgi:RNA-directed DNA polymerase